MLCFFFYFVLFSDLLFKSGGWAGSRVELRAGVNLHMVLIDWLGDACESEMCINVISCGQAFTVSDSPWKLCLWWVQTAGSPSFLIPFTPWHRRSICWAGSTTTKTAKNTRYFRHYETESVCSSSKYLSSVVLTLRVRGVRLQCSSGAVANTHLND